MSLPSCAIVRSANGEVIAQPFINCGWFLNSDNLSRILYSQLPYQLSVEDPPVDINSLPNEATVEAYGEKVTIGLLRSMETHEQLKEFFEVKWKAERAIKQNMKVV